MTAPAIPAKYGEFPAMMRSREAWATEILAHLLNQWLVVGNCLAGIEALDCLLIQTGTESKIGKEIRDQREALAEKLVEAAYQFRGEVREACLTGVRASLFVFENDTDRGPPVGTHSQYVDLAKYGGSLVDAAEWVDSAKRTFAKLQEADANKEAP